MRLTILTAPIAAIVVGIVWLSAGRSVTEFADRFITVDVPVAKIDGVENLGGEIRAAGLTLTFGGLNNLPLDLRLHCNSANMALLKSGGHSFVLGPLTIPPDGSGRPDFSFVPGRGDEVSLAARRSLVGWPTPFEYTIMVQSPSWKRYVYYRLVWKKPSGATLIMLWRYEQDYFKGRGWIEPLMMWDFHTGLLRVEIHP